MPMVRFFCLCMIDFFALLCHLFLVCFSGRGMVVGWSCDGRGIVVEWSWSMIWFFVWYFTLVAMVTP